MIIDRNSLTQVVYFTKQPPQFFIDALTGHPVSDKEREAALTFYERNNRLLTTDGNILDNEIIDAVTAKEGVGPLMVSRKFDSLLLLPTEVN